jgi:polyhydroxybutyrate depolymerase
MSGLRRFFVIIQAALAVSALLCTRGSSQAPAASELVRREWQVDGVAREALLSIPANARTSPTPVLFAFHGHGGGMRQAAFSMGFHRLWPEAIVVYMQGLPTPGRLTDPEGRRAGWQSAPGDQHDRDLRFFDAVLASLKKDYKVDTRRIYCTGHSNGGGFTYLLWATRGDVLAAVAPSSAVAPTIMKDLKPKPVLHVAGEKDPLVKFSWQELTINQLRRINGCGDGMPQGQYQTLYPSKGGTPVVTYIHPGGHTFPREAVQAIVKFLQGQSKP